MTNEEREKDAAEQTDGDVGDVESAGETTAADTVSGPANTKPVGADTKIEVAAQQDRSGRKTP